MKDDQIQAEGIEEEKQRTNIGDRFKRLGSGLKKRLFKFTIVSLIGLGINLGALALTEFIIGEITTVLDTIYEIWIFKFTIKGLIAIAFGIAAATTSNYILNKIWTFSGAKAESVKLQFLKYAIVGGSGAVLKYLLTTAFTNPFSNVIPNIDNATLAASSIAFVITVFWNYIWNEVWTFDVIKKIPEEPIVITPDMDFSDITLITPTYNETENIGP
ncbi:MAG: GtrA family protein, partial [Candidatus Heimdallarchaeota archaeon]